jgi:hypothetical protein
MEQILLRKAIKQKVQRNKRVLFSERKVHAFRGVSAAQADPRRRCAPHCSLCVPPPPHRSTLHRRCAPSPPADRASAAAAAAAAAARGPCPGCPALGTPYVTAAATPVAELTPQPSRHQPLPPAALPGTSTPH